MLTENNLCATHAESVQAIWSLLSAMCGKGSLHGRSNPQLPILQFLQQNITDKQVQFAHDNSSLAPAYQVSVSDGRITTEPASSHIDFDMMPLLIHNQLTIGQGQTVTLTNTQLLATHNDSVEPGLTFVVTNVQNGGFLLLSDADAKLGNNASFLQQQVIDGQVAFSAQGSSAPAYQVSVTDGRLTTDPQPAAITFFWKPMLTHNQFLTNRGQTTVLTTDNIAATRNDTLAEDLQFVVTGVVKHGRFEQRGDSGSIITSFYQQDILRQNIQFTHDNSTRNTGVFTVGARQPDRHIE